MENNNSIKIKRKGTGNVLQLRYAENSDGSLMPVLYFPALEKTGLVRHLFTTRFGGVSSGIFSSMNLSSTRGDDPACVDENFRRAAAAVGLTRDRLVFDLSGAQYKDYTGRGGRRGKRRHKGARLE